MAEKYRAGIIGCGSIAHAHMQGYLGLDNVEVVAIADPVPEALEEFGERYGISKRYADFRRMLDEEKLDIVSNATWHKLHAPVTIAACARKPKAVLCEKPMATTLGECDEMLIASQRNKVKLAIAHQRRFNPAWTEARRLIAEGAIGQVRQVTARGNQGLLNDCSHLFDMMRYLLGDPRAEWVIGNLERQTDRYERDIRIEDRSAGIVGFSNGTVGQLLQEIGGPGYQGGIFYGTDGILELDEQKARLLSSRTGKWEERPGKGEDPHVAQARELVEWIEGRAEHRGQAENGRAAVEIIMAIYESARLHEVVTLPVRTRCSPLDLMVEEGALPVERPGRYDVRAFLLRGEAMRPAGTQ
jgi:predicted dehydrogenase